MTLNNILALLKKFADDHLQINSYGQGPTDDMTVKDQLYAAMWVALLPSTYSEKAMNHRMAVIFYDRLKHDKSNELEVQSDMLSVAMDLVAYLRDNPDFDINLTGDPSINYFTERFTDWCSGVEMTITIKDPKPLDRCVIPFS
ncbi:hypothetical protein [Chitinophaga cymbidii]|uniref:Uncharacterized protein n=1 Tax=Chitinophaga cymbidii TaxID=1096750 RepID=A0A512RIN8_9BACT|nr:hypothetical protein [Chitinophaga cymbidii]GEP95573.1 hypothetical protein CCY01nite_18330 [Chitinophaga cymbidii]